MPPILNRLIQQLTAQGHDINSARAIAISQLQKHGILKAGTEDLTEKGHVRQALGAAGRAKDRAAKASKHHNASDYMYNPFLNRARLRKKR